MVKKKSVAQAKTAENETVKTETKVAEKTEAAEKETTAETEKTVTKAKKTTTAGTAKTARATRKTTAKKTVKKTSAPKTAEEKTIVKTEKKAVEQEMILQFGGREIKEKDLYEKIYQIWIEGYGKKAEDLKSLKVYVKPEEFTAYYVINDTITGSIDL